MNMMNMRKLRFSLLLLASLAAGQPARSFAVTPALAPEFTHSSAAEWINSEPRTVAAVKKLGIDYPVMLDNDFSYWNALGNRYWPACYLIGPTGRIEAMEIGELHRGEARGDRFERQIQRLLAAR